MKSKYIIVLTIVVLSLMAGKAFSSTLLAITISDMEGSLLLPGAIWLFLSGLLGFLGLKRGSI